jgi:hypothetical protein
MIYLWEGTTPEQLTAAREQHLIEFVCGAAGHPPATRQGTRRTECLCGYWMYQVTEPADPTVSMVTVEALREEVRACQRRIQDLRDALEDAIACLAIHGRVFAIRRLQDVLNGKASR